MNLQEQLNTKADDVFQKAYLKLFSNFIKDFYTLTGKNIDGDSYALTKEEKEALAPLIKAMSLRYTLPSQENRPLYDAVRELHRANFIKQFIAKVEEVQAFMKEQR